LASLASSSLFILLIFNIKTPGISLSSSADSLDCVFVTPAECDARLSQLANVTFSSPHAKQFVINRSIAMSLPMCVSNVGVIVVVGPCSRDHLA